VDPEGLRLRERGNVAWPGAAARRASAVTCPLRVTMIFSDQCQSETSARLLRRKEGLENPVAGVAGDAGRRARSASALSSVKRARHEREARIPTADTPQSRCAADC
jgi:hypothetical protein